MITLEPDQRETVDKCKAILALRNIVYLAAWMRTGKSIMGLTTAYEMGWKRVCVLTKKNAVNNIKADAAACNYNMTVLVTNFEQAKKLPATWDGFIVDEANEGAGDFPIPTKRAKEMKILIGSRPLILMSATPTPESPSQIYHQFWLSMYSPFRQYANFYKWSKDYCKQYEEEVKQEDGSVLIKTHVKQRFINGFKSNDYSEGLEDKIKTITAPYMVYLSQQDAGFTSYVEEEIIFVPINKLIYKLMKVLKRDKVYTMKCGDVIICDTPVKMQTVFHQLSSGTIKIDDKKSHTLDESKAWFVKSKFAGSKIAIFYKFIQEYELLKKVFPDHTSDDREFNKHDHLVYLKQIVSGRSGVDLQTADYLIMYNIDFSATSYWQGRERMGNRKRTKQNKMFWIFSEHGFEKKVYKAVVKKIPYTIAHFKKDLKSWDEPIDTQQLSINGH